MAVMDLPHFKREFILQVEISLFWWITNSSHQMKFIFLVNFNKIWISTFWLIGHQCQRTYVIIHFSSCHTLCGLRLHCLCHSKTHIWSQILHAYSPMPLVLTWQKLVFLIGFTCTVCFKILTTIKLFIYRICESSES